MIIIRIYTDKYKKKCCVQKKKNRKTSSFVNHMYVSTYMYRQLIFYMLILFVYTTPQYTFCV